MKPLTAEIKILTSDPIKKKAKSEIWVLNHRLQIVMFFLNNVRGKAKNDLNNKLPSKIKFVDLDAVYNRLLNQSKYLYA